MSKVVTYISFMNSAKTWKTNRKRNTPSYNFKYQPFGLYESNMKKLSLIGYEKVVDRINNVAKMSDFILSHFIFKKYLVSFKGSMVIIK